MKTIRVGSRDSQLAMVQTETVIDLLKKNHSDQDVRFEIVSMKTIGDQILDKALAKVGEKNLFTKELEIALRNERVDLIVHSLKDLPTTLEDDFEIGAILKRGSPLDAVILRKDLQNSGLKNLQDLPVGAKVGTSSLRRVAQLKRKHRHIDFESIRGNLNTRLRKLDQDSNYDAIVLAEAGVSRLGWSDRISFTLEPGLESCCYAVGQGALAVELRKGDHVVMELLKPLNDDETVCCCLAERAFLKGLDGGCSTPVGVATLLSNKPSMNWDDFRNVGAYNNHNKDSRDGEYMHIFGRVLSLDGSKQIFSQASAMLAKQQAFEQNGHTSEHGDTGFPSVELTGLNPKMIENFSSLRTASEMGSNLATDLLSKGAKKLLQECKEAIAKDILANPSLNPQKSIENQINNVIIPSS